jgi:hypothetical protein
MLKWFSMHINWALFIFTICIDLVSYYIVSLFLHITHIPYWGPVFPANTIEVLLPAFTSFSFDTRLLLSSIVLMVPLIWVLQKKNRSRIYLFYFLPFLIVEFPVLLSYIIVFDFPFVIYTFRIITLLIWFSGWIVLLSLKNKSRRVGSTQRNPPVLSTPKSL